MSDKKNKNIMLAINIAGILAIILYLLILNFGHIKNNEYLVPTGNVDIFEIDCDCKENGSCTPTPGHQIIEEPEDKPVIGNNQGPINNNQNPNTGLIVDRDDGETSGDENTDNSNNNKPENGGQSPDVGEDKPIVKDLIVSDDYTIWGNEKARIFSNPSYEYESKIAPGSSNSYTFVIKNSNDFDVIVDFEMIEDNPYKVNLKYKLKSEGKYIVGDEDNYDDVSKLQIKNVKIKANESIPYVLDWKWIDSENDTEIGEKLDANYKLTINIGANQSY